MFEFVNFPTCVKVMYLRICNIFLGLVLRECQFYFFAFIELRVHIKKPLKCSMKETLTKVSRMTVNVSAQ